MIPWGSFPELKARILPKLFLAASQQCHKHYTGAGFDCRIANLPNRAKAWSDWDVKKESTWDAKKEPPWDGKQESSWDSKQESSWDGKQESTWDGKEKTAGLS